MIQGMRTKDKLVILSFKISGLKFEKLVTMATFDFANSVKKKHYIDYYCLTFFAK